MRSCEGCRGARSCSSGRPFPNLRHPNVVPVYDFGDADGVLYLAMALIDAGHSLRDLLIERAPLPLADAPLILTPLAAALDYLPQHETRR